MRLGHLIMDEVEEPGESAGASPAVPVEKNDKEAKRLAKVIEKLQKESEDKDKRLAELATRHERDKLEEGERLKLELADARKVAERLMREKEDLTAAQTKKETIWSLVTEHNLLSTDFGEIVLKGFDAETDSLDEYIKKVKKDKKLKVLFRPDDDSGVADTPPPHGTTSTRGRKPADGNTDEDRERAKTLFPHDARKQEIFLQRLKTSERGK